MPGSSSHYWPGPSLRRGHEVGERVQSNEMGVSVLIMQPILRFLQLLCENHNRDLQVSASPHSTPSPAIRPPCGPQALPSGPVLMLSAALWPEHHCSVAGDSLAAAACRIVVPGRPFPAC